VDCDTNKSTGATAPFQCVVELNENPLWHGTPSPDAVRGISDNGMDINGCWLGNSCMPEGSECPHICYPMMPMECGAADIRCDMGMDSMGCWMGDYCMPADSECPPTMTPV